MTKKMLLLSFLLPGMAGMAQSTVTLSGHVKNVNNLLVVEDFSEFEYLHQRDVNPVFLPDSTGAFTLTFPLSAPNYFRIGRNVLYLSPGDHLQMDIDTKNQENSMFSGDGAAANNYLRNTPFPKAGSYIDAGSRIYPAPETTVDSLLAIAQRRRSELDALTGVTTEFKRLEAARIKADVLNSIQAIPSYLYTFRGHQYNDEYIREFNTLVEPLVASYSRNFIDASLMKLLVYRDAVNMILKQPHAASPDEQQIRDWLKADAVVYDMQSVKDKAGLNVFRSSLNKLNNEAYRKSALAYLDYLQQFGIGDPAVDFTCRDLDGNPVQLSSLKGKLIYVDFWATWCGPCMREMPALDALKEKYKDDPGVAFVSVSIDDESNIAGWKKNVEQRKADGYQWQINRAKLNAYNLTEVPRMLLIGKDFRMVDLHAPLPSNRSLENIIDKLKG